MVGTHGSLSKAGKSRDRTKHLIKRDERGKVIHHNKPHKSPLRRNRNNYHKKVTLVRIYGQDACKNPKESGKRRRRKRR